MMASHAFLLTDTMPCEVGIGALFSLVDSVEVLTHSINEARNGSLLKYIEAKCLFASHLESVVLLGTYWFSSLAEAAKSMRDTQFFVYSSGDLTDEQIASLPENVDVVKPREGDDNTRPIHAIVRFYKKLDLIGSALSALLRMHKDSIKDVEDRMLSHNTLETQMLVSGLMNHRFFHRTCSLHKRYLSLWTGDIGRLDLIEKGKDVLEWQIGMVYENVKNNSKVVVTPEGKPVATATATSLVNLTHETLKDFHHVDQTLTVNILFHNNMPEQLQVSHRSFDGTNVLPYAVANGGGGAPNGAGARIDMPDFPWTKIFSTKVPDREEEPCTDDEEETIADMA